MRQGGSGGHQPLDNGCAGAALSGESPAIIDVIDSILLTHIAVHETYRTLPYLLLLEHGDREQVVNMSKHLLVGFRNPVRGPEPDT